MSEYLSDEEQLARLHSWWRTNGLMLVLALVIGIGGVLGWRWYQQDRAATIGAASSLYAEYLAADVDQQAALSERLQREFPDSAYATFAQMHTAKQALDTDDASAAAKELKASIKAGVPAAIADLNRIRLARLQQQEGDSAAALTSLAQVRGSGFRSMVAELKGDILMHQGDRVGAHEAYTAALADLVAGEDRPVLKMKQVNTATVDDARLAAIASDISDTSDRADTPDTPDTPAPEGDSMEQNSQDQETPDDA